MTKLLVFLPLYSISYIIYIVLLTSLMLKIEQRAKFTYVMVKNEKLMRHLKVLLSSLFFP